MANRTISMMDVGALALVTNGELAQLIEERNTYRNAILALKRGGKFGGWRDLMNTLYAARRLDLPLLQQLGAGW
jgi:hypothetical protein